MAKAKKKEEKVVTRVNFILDETGSMCSCARETISGFNEYIQTLKKDAKDILFSLTKFNSSRVEVTHKDIPLAEVAVLTDQNYRPDNLTPLYDAIGKTIAELKDIEGKVLVVVMTDGEENASKEYSRDKIFALIKEKEKVGWTFLYLGANQDSWANAQQFGFSKGNVTNFNTDNVKAVMNCVATSNARYSADVSLCGNTSQYFAQYGGVDTDKPEEEKVVTKQK